MCVCHNVNTGKTAMLDSAFSSCSSADCESVYMPHRGADCESVSVRQWGADCESVCVRNREEGLQREVRDLEQRCQASEARHQDLAANIPEATRPLLRQLEAMQVYFSPPPVLTSPSPHPTLYPCSLMGGSKSIRASGRGRRGQCPAGAVELVH